MKGRRFAQEERAREQQLESDRLMNEREQQMFNDRQRYMSMYNDLNKLETLPEDQQEAYLQARIAKLQEEGKDPSDTMAYLQADAETREKIRSGFRRIGQERGFINRVEEKEEDLLTVYDRETGTNVVVPRSEFISNRGRYEAQRQFGATETGRQQAAADAEAELERERQALIAQREAGVSPEQTAYNEELEKQRAKTAAAQEAEIAPRAQALQSELGAIDRAERLLDEGVNVGLESYIPGSSALSPKTQEFEEVAAQLTLANKDLLGGGVLSDGDIALLSRTTIDPRKSEEANEEALKEMKAVRKRGLAELRRQQAYIRRNGSLRGYESSYLGESSAERNINEREQQDRPIVRRQTQDGRIALFDAETREFIGYE